MSGERRWKRTLTVNNETFRVVFSERPFREGLQVSTMVGATPLVIAELGLGEQAALERLRAEILRVRNVPNP